MTTALRDDRPVEASRPSRGFCEGAHGQPRGKCYDRPWPVSVTGLSTGSLLARDRAQHAGRTWHRCAGVIATTTTTMMAVMTDQSFR